MCRGCLGGSGTSGGGMWWSRARILPAMFFFKASKINPTRMSPSSSLSRVPVFINPVSQPSDNPSFIVSQYWQSY
jgi:hypothetical protein